jgi:enoyl-CoA hydratase/carnithine racemase
MDPYTQVAYQVAGSVATITLNRPEARNGYTMTMADELRSAFDRADLDDEVRVVVLTGAGRDFTVGADLSGGGFSLLPGDTPPDDWVEPAGRVSMRIFAMNKPVIAALNGAAVGAGSTIPLACDFRLAATDTRFGFVFTRRGITAEGGSFWFLPRLVGLGRALDWMITGRVFDAGEALAAGLVRSVHEPGELLDAAYALAAEIVSHTAPVAVAITRQMLYRASPYVALADEHRLESLLVGELVRRPDAAEGVLSFLQRRPAQFPGKVGEFGEGLPEFLPWVRGSTSVG